MRRVAPLVALGGACLTGCGAGAALNPARLDDLRSQGVASDLVYVVDLPGYRLAEDTASLYDEVGFQAYYVSPRGRLVWLAADRGAFGDGLCAETPVLDAGISGWEGAGGPVQEADDVPGAPPSSVACERDDVGWYRRSGRRHEYVVLDGDRVIRLGGRRVDVDRAALKEAMSGLRPVTGGGTGMGDPRYRPRPRSTGPAGGGVMPVAAPAPRWEDGPDAHPGVISPRGF